MKTNSKQQNRSYALGVLLLLMTIIMVGCVYLDSINLNQGTEEEPIYWVKTGEVATFTVKGHIDAAGGETKRFLVAILVPKSWNARENTTVTYIADGVEDGVTSLPMSPVDTKLVPKNATVPWAELLMAEYGVSTNVLNDMEWVAFRTDKIYSIKQHDKASFTITLRCKTGPKNLRFKPAFFINFAEDDFPQKEEYKKYSPGAQCFEVVEGDGGITDFCSFHFNRVEPLAALQDDYVTFSFLGDIYSNDLVKADAIYMEATAYTDNGNVYSVDERSEKTLMIKEDRVFSETYNLTIWPAGFFGIPEGEVITRIDYIFTNEDGTINITGTDDKIAAQGGEIEGEEQPFSYELICE